MGGSGGSGVPMGNPMAGNTGMGMAGRAGSVAMGMAGMTGGMAGRGTAGMGTAGMGTAGMGTAGMGTAGMGTAGTSGGSSCLDGITNFDANGPFMFETKTSGSVKMWVPKVPAGCKVPIVHLANGTGATCGTYGSILTRLASHGFFATCYENPNTGQGTQCVMALETSMMMYPDLIDKKIGSTGHSQGGGASFTCLQRAEAKWGDSYTYAGLAMQPASGFGDSPVNWASMYGMIKSPMFMFSGTADILVSEAWVRQAFNAMSDSNESYWWSAVGSTHIPTPNAETAQVAVPWFRWKLLGDNAACKAFKALPDGPDWDVRMEKNAKMCQ